VTPVSRERQIPREGCPAPKLESTMNGDLIMRAAAFAFLIGVFVYAFAINL
jgi:hypothetical protein